MTRRRDERCDKTRDEDRGARGYQRRDGKYDKTRLRRDVARTRDVTRGVTTHATGSRKTRREMLRSRDERRVKTRDGRCDDERCDDERCDESHDARRGQIKLLQETCQGTLPIA